jgi:hypothetical protein
MKKTRVKKSRDTVPLTMLTYVLYDSNEHMISMHTTV